MRPFTLLLVSVFLFFSQELLAKDLIILTENLPPLNYLDNGKLVGPSVEIVQEIQKRLGSNEPIQVLPWARAYKMALEEENVVLFGTTQTQARHKLFKWVGPLATKRDILVGLKGTKLKISSLEDAKKVSRIGTLRDDTRENFLRSLGFTNLDPVSNEQKNAKKLILGRIDLWTYKKPGLKTVCELAGVDYNALEEVLHLRTIDVSIAFSKQTSDAVVAQWQKAFDEMTQDGTIAEIRSKWDQE
jgi:polar amino acid transport system substrate-binding protein